MLSHLTHDIVAYSGTDLEIAVKAIEATWDENMRQAIQFWFRLNQHSQLYTYPVALVLLRYEKEITGDFAFIKLKLTNIKLYMRIEF
jgi:hypothetical protein